MRRPGQLRPMASWPDTFYLSPSAPPMTIKGKATSLDIAHLAGVSQPTVSRALRGRLEPPASPCARLHNAQHRHRVREVQFTRPPFRVACCLWPKQRHHAFTVTILDVQSSFHALETVRRGT